MALTAAEVEEFISAIQQDPALRDRVRNAILADDFLALPGLVRQLVEQGEAFREDLARHDARMDQLTARMDQLAEQMTLLTQRIDRLAAFVENINGRVGNLEGWQYEDRYRRNLAAHLVQRFRKVQTVDLGSFAPVLTLLDDRKISQREFDNLMKLDILARGREKGNLDGPEVFVAIELSILVDISDVQRANERAETLRMTGLPVQAAVDGDAIRPEAEALARERGVLNLLAYDFPD